LVHYADLFVAFVSAAQPIEARVTAADASSRIQRGQGPGNGQGAGQSQYTSRDTWISDTDK